MSASASPVSSLLEATAPPERRGIGRDEVRMLVTDRAMRTHASHRFLELPAILRDDDLLVVNDSATLPASLQARRENGDVFQLHVATMIDARIWMVEPRATVRRGEEVRLPHGGSAVMIAPVEPEHPRVWYAWFGLPLPMHEYLMRAGEPIRYGYVTQHFPLRDYQTIFANVPGSAEMPSAARPFTSRVLRALAQRGVATVAITLHCGVASFEAPERPIAERYAVSDATAGVVNAARKRGGRVIAVGTTVVRALESSAAGGVVSASSGWTDLVIDRDHRPAVVDGLLSGFHDANATHQWMLQAFAEAELLTQAYALAAELGYYRHEFGDVHLLI